MIFRKLRAVKFRKTAAEINAVDVFRKRVIVKRRKIDNFRTGVPQKAEIVLVIEAERLVAGDREPDGCGGKRVLPVAVPVRTLRSSEGGLCGLAVLSAVAAGAYRMKKADPQALEPSVRVAK